MTNKLFKAERLQKLIKKIFPTYKQAFFSMFKVKVQMILLILLTIILTASISLAMSTINNLKQSNNFMGQEVKYDYYYKFNFSNTDFTESNKLTVSDFSISNNPNDDSLITLKTKNVQLITKKVNEQYTIDNIKLVNYLKWEQINHQSSYFQKSIIGKILKEKYHYVINNIEFKQLFNKFINVIDIYFSSLLNKMLWNYYINIYKNNPNFFQYPPDNNINNIEIFKQYLITNWLAEQNPSLKNKTNIAKSVTTRTIENNILMQMQNELAGIATNFKVTTRREFILTDFASNFNYRFVNIDSLNPHSLKIIQGTSPDASNQIVISPQFAKLRGYNIGDKIKIGDFNFMITGIGGDNWTVLPSTNQLNPIPNYANEPIVFLKNWVFFDNFLQ